MIRFCKWIYPQVLVGKSHKRPIMPEAFIRIADITVTWDITSATDANRAEFWEYDSTHEHAAELDTAYTTYATLADYELEAYNGLTKVAWIAANPPPV